MSIKSSFLSANPLSYDFGLLILRVVSGAALLTHGYPKFQKVISGNMQFGDPLGIGQGTSLHLAAFAEFICAILIIMGLLTRLASIPLIINMAVACLIVHATDDFGTKEMSLLYLGIFLTIFFTGPGKFSADRLIWN
ncbi:DoxX family protein [Daejeonella lutea]|uniref:Putative oxidoreductase n=1 Tax=Daejeonella lutea TaxID=572036 RepID=A0A1T5A3W3_9SPHI|nr:DoxX family protein [Daejeonella lutea]SKB29656.1 putative oxidoreductase [Daejeonella lutea]